MMKLSSEFVQHLLGWNYKWEDTIKADENCKCGIKEKHEHCPCCGKVCCLGGGTIAEFKLKWRQ